MLFTKKCRRFFAILLLLSPAVSSGQGFYNTTNWKFSNPRQFGFSVLDLNFYDNNNVIAVGSDGGIAKSTDGGSNWTYGPFTFLNPAGVLTKATFNDVHYVTSSVIYAVGNPGVMAKSTDAGVTWNFIKTPLFSNGRNINTVWFLNKDTGYIAGQHNTPDSLPKIYFTKNGGTTWDSLNAPVANGKSRIGYVANTNYPATMADVTAKDKEIYRIQFLNDSVGYIVGSGLSTYLPIPSVSSTTTCTATTNTISGSHHASLVWKIEKNVITDYSTTKERLGYTGVPSGTITCTSRYGSLTAATQTYRAMNIVNDSTLLIMSFNNNIVVKIRTGKNDSTLNIGNSLYEKGKYEVLNFPFPPTGSPIPPVQVLLASNPYQIKRASNGKFYAAAGSGLMWSSADTGRNWIQERSLPTGQNYSSNATMGFDIAPNGKFLTAGALGVVADSVPGTAWKSNYLTVPLTGGYSKFDFADCSNGIAAGGSSITVTTDGGATWIDKARPDFAASFYNINGLSYVNTSKVYFGVSNGTIYTSVDKGTTLDPVFTNTDYQMQDVATVGKDTVWAVGSSQFSVPAASRTSAVFRSFNGGTTWSTYAGFPMGSTAPSLTDIEFPSRLIGYAAGSRDTIYKTTDAGVTWSKLPLPTPGVTPQITYTDMYALDNNTVFLTGNGFPRKVVYKTTDGGNTWTDITNNILSIYPSGNLNGVLFHDANNGYVVGPGGALLKTTNGGASWQLDIAPTANLFTAMAFAPRTVPAGIGMPNRRLYVSGLNVQGAPIMEYGNPANIAVNSTETVVNPTCTNLSGGSITINASGAIAPYTYSINGSAFQSSNVFTGLTQGVKTIVIKDAFCGMLTKNVTLTLDNNLTLATIPATDTTACTGSQVALSASSAAGATFAWTPATGLSNPGISNPVATIASAVTYTVTATLGSCVKTKSISISVKQSPAISAGPDKTIVAAGQGVMLEGSGLANAASITWTPAATLSNANIYTPVANPLTTTTYVLTVVDNANCTSTDNATVTVIPYCVKALNAFTPNGDGINDKWIVTNGGCTKQIVAKVYNRSGSLVYSNDNYQNDWDGTYKGKLLPDGTYYYVLAYRLLDGREVPVKGDVTILR